MNPSILTEDFGSTYEKPEFEVFNVSDLEHSGPLGACSKRCANSTHSKAI